MQPLVSSLLHDLVGQTEQEVPSMSTGLGGSEDRKVTEPRISKQNLWGKPMEDCLQKPP